MSAPVTVRAHDRLHTWAVVLSSLVIPLPLIVGALVEAILDSTNPEKVDVTQDLAYLRELLGSSFGSLGILLVSIVALLVTLYLRERTLNALALPLVILAVQVVVGIALLILTGVVDGIENSYSASLL